MCNIIKSLSESEFYFLFICFSIYSRYFFYYFLVYLNVGVKRFEKVLVILIVATCLGFILQHLFFPKIIFFASAGEWISLSATPHRFIQITAQSLISLGIFLGFNKFLELKNKLYAILSFVCFVCILIRDLE